MPGFLSLEYVGLRERYCVGEFGKAVAAMMAEMMAAQDRMSLDARHDSIRILMLWKFCFENFSVRNGGTGLLSRLSVEKVLRLLIINRDPLELKVRETTYFSSTATPSTS